MRTMKKPKQEIVETETHLPATEDLSHIKQFGNIGVEHMTLPALKLLQGLSPEVKERHELRAGSFWHSILEQDLGKELDVVVHFVHAGGAVLSPRLPNGEGGLILARSPDDKNWETPNIKIPVTLPGGFKTEYDLGANIHASGLRDWGSSDPRDKKSPPAYTTQFTVVMRILGIEGPVLYKPSRSGNVEVMNLNTKIMVRQANGHHPRKQVYKLNCYERSSGPTISWFVPRWTASGMLEDERLFQAIEREAEQISRLYKNIKIVGLDEADDSVPFTAPAGEHNAAF